MVSKKSLPLYIILILASIVSIVPFIWILLSSFKNTLEIYNGPFVPEIWRYQNFPETWRRARMGIYFNNSLYITVLAPLISVVINTLAGYSFAKLHLKKYTWLFYIFLLGLYIPAESNLLSITIQVGSLGMHNSLRGVVLAIVGGNIAFGIFMMRNFFRDIPDSFGESAKIDGAGKITIFLKIYVPLAKSAIVALSIFSLIGAWNEFNLSLFILTDSDKWTIPIGIYGLRTALYTVSYGMVFAGAVICIIPVLILYILFQRSFVEGITAGGTKG